MPAAKILGKTADDYGPIYSLTLGSHRAVLVSSWQMVKKCFTINDRNFATRPNLAVSRYMIYENAGFALAPYGPHWREIRKLGKDNGRLFKQRKRTHEQVTEVILYTIRLKLLTFHFKKTKRVDRVLDVWKLPRSLGLEVCQRLACQSRVCMVGSTSVREAIKKGLYLLGAFVVSDHVPNFEWMDIGGHIKAMKQVANELNSVVKKWFDEHVEMRKEYDMMLKFLVTGLKPSLKLRQQQWFVI
ncbi:cytochrome P450 [Artemisia annua]|uniref:Cytochrome P450 n=1 Tax=Artemisia annua TaxID=35608 RepID=A0A2U1KNZ0_ARTAN|nr:cytochrome P450 [Artemisia annua]